MKLRELQVKDASLMLEWMHDESVVKDLQADFAGKTIEDCLKFIEDSQKNGNYHLAIVDDNDIYMGTVSLKNITKESAEFAITIRSVAMGKGYSQYGMKEIIRMAKEELGIPVVYWYVYEKNARAVRFYDKNGYQRCNPRDIPLGEIAGKIEVEKYIWYCV